MGRQKKEADKEYVKAEEAVEETFGLNRHPQSVQDEVQEVWNEPSAEETETEKGFTAEGEFIAKSAQEESEEEENEDESEDEEDGEETEEAPEEPEQEKSLHEEADEEFMEGVWEEPKKPLTPQQIKARKETIIDEIEKTQQRIDLLAPIEELSKAVGFEKLMDLIKTETFKKIDDFKFSDGKKGITLLETVDLVAEKARSFSAEYYGKKRELKQKNEEFERLQCPQLDLFANNPDAENSSEEALTETEESVTENNIAASNSELEAVSEIETEEAEDNVSEVKTEETEETIA